MHTSLNLFNPRLIRLLIRQHNRSSSTSHTTRTSKTVNEIDGGVWDVEEEDVLDVLGVDTSGGDIGRDQDLHLVLLCRILIDRGLGSRKELEDLGGRAVWGIALEFDGINTLGFEVIAEELGGFALVDEDDGFLDEAGFGAVLGDVVEDIGAGEGFVAAVGFGFGIDDRELDAARDGVDVGSDDAVDFGEGGAETSIERAGDGGRAEDELLEVRGGVDDGVGNWGKGAVKEGVGFVDGNVCAVLEETLVFFAKDFEEGGCADEEVEGLGEETVANHFAGDVTGDEGGAELDNI